MSPREPSRVGVMAQSLWALASTGIIRPYRPDRLYRIAKTLVKWGTGPAGGYTALAARMPDTIGIIDERGSVTFDEVHRHSNAIARGLEHLGVSEGDGVAVMCRNHRWFVEATVGIAKLGADVLYLNTAFSGPQLAEVLEREQPSAVISDEEFAGLLDGVPAQVHRIIAWTDTTDHGHPTLSEMADSNDDADLAAPSREARTTILTSGTTGTPKGASRGSGSLDAAASLVSRLPLKHGWTVHVAAPMFHTWGWAHLNLSMLIGSTLVLRRKFDPADFLETITTYRCEAVVVIPVMLQRVLNLPKDVRSKADLSCVRAIAASGSALPGDLARRWMDEFGDTLFNIYGSTECAWATIATPAEMRQAPGTAGRPPIGTVVAIYDSDGEVADGEVGRIFVGNSMLFEGYTGGGNRDVVDGLMATGDVGRFCDGLLIVEGRDDEMIVSGGENVYPREVEDCLARHPGVADAAAIGVEDDDFGQRLRAFVVVKDHAVTEDDLRDHVKRELARYKVPRDVWFLDELPRNATGKIVKRELVAMDEPTG